MSVDGAPCPTARASRQSCMLTADCNHGDRRKPAYRSRMAPGRSVCRWERARRPCNYMPQFSMSCVRTSGVDRTLCRCSLSTWLDRPPRCLEAYHLWGCKTRRSRLLVLSHHPAYDTFRSACQQMWSKTALERSCFVERKIHQPSDDNPDVFRYDESGRI